jgi:hypothetical protein
MRRRREGGLGNWERREKAGVTMVKGRRREEELRRKSRVEY